jgi:hypothetical protein
MVNAVGRGARASGGVWAMPFFVVKAIHSQQDTLTLVDRVACPTQAAAEAAAQAAAPTPRGLVTLLVLEAPTAEEALRQAQSRAANNG